MIVWLNGTCLPAAEAAVPLLDGGYLYGDGVYETFRVYGGRPFDLAGHLARMARNLEALEYRWRPEAGAVHDALSQVLKANGWERADARARLTVSRGADPDDPMPLSGHPDLSPTVSLVVRALGGREDGWQRDGIALLSMPAAYARGNFPHLKTLNSLPTVTALRRARAAGCDEALLVDAEGRVLEAATSNVFLVRGRALVTPPLELGLLAGRTRALVLDGAAALGLEVREEAFGPAELAAADEAFLCGSVKEVVPVTAVDGRPAGGGRPGPVTRKVQEAYRAHVRAGLEREARPEERGSGPGNEP